MINFSPLAIGGLALAQDEPIDTGMEIVPKVKGPRRLLMDLLRQDPAMAEFFKKAKLKGDMGYGSMESDYGDQGER